MFEQGASFIVAPGEGKGPSQSGGGANMKVINCEDGEVITGADDDELVANARAHIDAAHPDLRDKLSREDILKMAVVTG